MAQTATQSVYGAKWTAATRDAYYQEHPENFADRKNKKFPIKDHSDVGDAWGLAGHGENPDAIRHAIVSIAKRMGFTDALPDTAKDFAKGKESTPDSEGISHLPESVSSSSSVRPRARIASIQVRWITDGARSVNGRIYPAETVSRLIASGQRKISDPDGLPVTCFLSHADADNDHTPALIGKATRIWRQGADGMAMIDIADTGSAREALGLIVGKYICTESLRASNAELRTDPRYDVPVVGGDRIELDGIDLTNYPGLEQVARIQQVSIAESAGRPAPLTEVFNLAPTALEICQPGSGQEGQSMSKSLNEAVPPGGNTVGGYSPTSGEAPFMTNDNPTDSYGQRMYKAPAMTSGPMQGMDSPGYAVDLQEAHDRIAMVQNRTCAPSRESARGQAILGSMSESERAALTEAGRSLSTKNDGHLDRAHDALAHHMSMDCEGKNNKMGVVQPADDGMQDGDADDKASESRKSRTQQKESTHMTPEEAAALLESAGYKIEKPKTEAEILKETIASLQAEQVRQREEQAKQLEEMKSLIAQGQQATPQRRSQVLGANIGEPATNRYQPLHGRHLQEQINKLDWSSLADRTAPLPEAVPLDLLMREMEQYYAVLYDNRYGILTAVQ